MPKLLTPDVFQKIRAVIARHHAAFVASAFGAGALDKDTAEQLRATGMLPKEPAAAVEQAYLYGQASAQLADPRVEDWSQERFEKWLEKNPIKLTEPERSAVDAANASAGLYCQGLGNAVAKDTGQMLIEADRQLREKLQGDIRGATAQNVAARETVRQLKTDLGWATRDWTRDLDRIAVTEKHGAMQQGALDYIRKRHGDGARVAVIPSPTCCPKCAELYLGPDGHPRIFKLDQIGGPGANVGRKQADWVPCCSTHPHCGCQVTHVPDGWGFGEDGELRPGGEGGVSYEGSGPEGVTKAIAREVAHLDLLRKAASSRELSASETSYQVKTDLDVEEWDACKDAVLRAVRNNPGIPFPKLTDRVSAAYGEHAGGQAAVWLAESGALRRDEKTDRFYPGDLSKARKLVGRVNFRGLKISLEHQAGGQRHWHDRNGEEGVTTMLFPYGYIRGTEGADGEHVDVYVGPNPESDRVFVVHQRKKLGPGKFGGYDEDKVMLGFSSPAEARAAYLAHYDDPGFFGSMSEIPFDEFKERCRDDDHHGEALLGGLPEASVDVPDLPAGILLVIPVPGAPEPVAKAQTAPPLPEPVPVTLRAPAPLSLRARALRPSPTPVSAGQTPTDVRKAHQQGPYIGPRGGKWADPEHTVSWRPDGGSPAAQAHPAAPESLPPAKPPQTDEDRARQAKGRKVLEGAGEHIPLSSVGVHPASPEEHAYARSIREDKDFWSKVPEQYVPGDSRISGTEEHVKSKSVGPVVRGEVPLREGYAPLMLRRADGSLVTVDGHHRMAMHRMMGNNAFAAKVAPMPAHADSSSAHAGKVGERVLRSLSDSIAEGKLKGSPEHHVKVATAELEKHRGALQSLKDDLAKAAPAGAEVKARVKELDSTVGKLVRKPKYGDATAMQDLTGARVILGNVDEVRSTVANLKQRYKVVTEDDYISKPQGDYRSHHLIIEHDGLQKEIQVRTARQNTFAMWSHHVYKPETPEQEAAARDHMTDIATYSKDAAEYLWRKDSGQATDPPPPPPCTRPVATAFGCLEFS